MGSLSEFLAGFTASYERASIMSDRLAFTQSILTFVCSLICWRYIESFCEALQVKHVNKSCTLSYS